MIAEKIEFSGLKHVISDPSTIFKLLRLSNLSLTLLCYQTIDKSEFPYLQYMLFKNNSLNSLELPLITFNDSILPTDDNTDFSENLSNLHTYCKLFLLNSIGVIINDEHIDLINCDGLYIYDQKLYMIVNLSFLKFDVKDLYLSTDYIWFALIDELINKKHICNIPIASAVTQFFEQNEDFGLIVDSKNNEQVVPMVWYCGKQTEVDLNFSFHFGQQKEKCPAKFGSFYYFTTFENAVKKGSWSDTQKHVFKYGHLITNSDNGKYIKGGVVRFAVFTKYTKFVDGIDDDKSDTKASLLNNKAEQLTLKITDYDGLWGEEFDSLYVGKLELADGSYFEDTPLMIVKHLCQQIPLSYHYINKTMLGDQYDENSLINIK
jgi:hypothetical protein